MALFYKIDVLDALRQKGISSYKIRKEKLLSESTIQKLRKGQPISWDNINSLCRLLECQPSDLIYYAED